MKRTAWPILLTVMALASCGSDTSSSGAVRVAVDSVLGGTRATAPPVITRSLLAQVITPVMLVTVDARRQQALIAEVQTNRDVATWSSVDDITLSFRNGVLVATRGMGADLMAADVPEVSRSSGSGKSHVRVHTLLNGEDQAVQTKYTCTFRTVGVENVEIVELSYQLTHIVESCAAGGVRFSNAYWLADDHRMRKSRQWVSPEVGFLTIEDVR